jgi:hypothetical protein
MDIITWLGIGLAGLAVTLSVISIIIISCLFIGQTGYLVYRKLLN